MPMTTLTCTCGKEFKRHDSKVRPGGSYFCSQDCRRGLTERSDGTFRCGRCSGWLPATSFKWWEDERYSEGKRRDSYCLDCKAEHRREYRRRPEAKAKARQRHVEWRDRCLQEGGDKAIRWWFTRQLGGYRKRSRDRSIPCDLDADFLVGLFHQQGGLCFYTGVKLEWESFGKKVATRGSMSVDRRDPKQGYVQDNVVLCTYFCNGAKRDLREEEFYEFCSQVLAVQNAREE